MQVLGRILSSLALAESSFSLAPPPRWRWWFSWQIVITVSPTPPHPTPHCHWLGFTLLSAIWCAMVEKGLGGNIDVFSAGLSENEWKFFNERVHKSYSSALVFAGTVNFFFPTWRVVPGGIFWPFCEKLWTVEHPERVVSFKKEAERGWKSGVTSLSWKSGWKPWTRREFWHQRI